MRLTIQLLGYPHDFRNLLIWRPTVTRAQALSSTLIPSCFRRMFSHCVAWQHNARRRFRGMFPSSNPLIVALYVWSWGSHLIYQKTFDNSKNDSDEIVPQRNIYGARHPQRRFFLLPAAWARPQWTPKAKAVVPWPLKPWPTERQWRRCFKRRPTIGTGEDNWSCSSSVYF